MEVQQMMRRSPSKGEDYLPPFHENLAAISRPLRTISEEVVKSSANLGVGSLNETNKVIIQQVNQREVSEDVKQENESESQLVTQSVPKLQKVNFN
jgi:hypothetical protein